MFSQVKNAGSVATVDAVPSVSSGLHAKSQNSVTPVELPHQAVKVVASDTDAGAVKKAAAQINNFLQQFDHNLQFSVDQDTGKQVVKVVDTQTKDVIRQMPTEEMLAIAKVLDKVQGLLIKEKA